MIELSRKLENLEIYEAIEMFHNLYTWLLIELKKMSEESKGWVRGYLILHDMASNSVGSLFLLTEDAPESKILELLQQPPGEYKEKYQAHIIERRCEPEVVTEVPATGMKRPSSSSEEEDTMNESEDGSIKMEIDES